MNSTPISTLQILEIFLDALNTKKTLELTINTKSKGIIKRQVVPLDQGGGEDSKFHFFTLNSPQENHFLSLSPNQILEINVLKETFNPEQYSNARQHWSIPRNWKETLNPAKEN